MAARSHCIPVMLKADLQFDLGLMRAAKVREKDQEGGQPNGKVSGVAESIALV